MRRKIYTKEEARVRKNEYQKRYKLSEKGKKTQARYYVSKAKKASSVKWRKIKENKVKIAAHKVVEAAIKSGRLVKEVCEVCGKGGRINAHHDDYNMPLVVRWLCNVHHSKYHKELESEVKE